MVLADFHQGMSFKFRTKTGRSGYAEVRSIQEEAREPLDIKWVDRHGVRYERFHPKEFLSIQIRKGM